MLTRRVIPCLDVDRGRVIRGVRFSADRVVGDAVELAAEYNRQGADELVFYDITASAEERGLMLDVLERAAAHIHTVGKKPGAYLASIQMGQYDKGKRMGGFVRSGSPLAHLLEGGAKPPPHQITASAASVLAFSGDAGIVFRRAVQHPGATIPPYPAFRPAMEAHRTEITEKLTQAVREAAAKR